MNTRDIYMVTRNTRINRIKMSKKLRTAELLDDLIPNLMHEYHVPGVSVAMIKNSGITWCRQYGVKESGRKEAVTENTIFEACSMTKPYFAYAALKLVEEGIINLDVPLVRYLGGHYIQDEPLHQKITMRMVLTHTSGLPNWRPNGRDSDEPLVVHFEPGTDFLYSGEGFWFLQKVVERITQVPIDVWLKERLGDPLGMNSSSLTWQKHYEKSAASSHDKNAQVRKDRAPFTQANAAYSLYTTPLEYAKFLLEVMDSNRSGAHSLGKDLWQEMLFPHQGVPIKDPNVKHVSRGLGWEILKIGHHRYYQHSGNNRGFRCVSRFNLETRSGIVLMTNADNGAELWRCVLSKLDQQYSN